MNLARFLPFSLCLILGLPSLGARGENDAERLRAAIPRATAPPIIDGVLEEYEDAFSAPLEYFHRDVLNRAAQFYFLWDKTALYVGVRTLDEKPFAPNDLFWTGDAVEWYCDTRSGSAVDRRDWAAGAVHCFFTALTLDQLGPRFTLRPGYESAIPKIGVEVAGQRFDVSLEYEFKLPWANFPDFVPAEGVTFHLDTELSYSDGDARTFRSFVFGSPLSVQQPANLAKVILVDKFKPEHWKFSGPVMLPIRVDTAWQQESEPHVHVFIALPPNRRHEIGDIKVQLIDPRGELIAEYDADQEEVIHDKGNFARRAATWRQSVAAPGSYHVQAIVYDANGQELARVAPRLVSVNMDPGY